ncbi:MAG: WD40 repeat domain-containing protein [Methanoregula sp.]|nr:WD40 repeat domain-containing protein [Methanoregula sp.]
MIKRFRIHLIIAIILLSLSLTGVVTAIGLVKTWEERTPADTPFSGVVFSKDSETITAGGSQLFVRSWDGDKKWWGFSGRIAAMSADGNYFVSAVDRYIHRIDKNGTEIWIVGTNTPVRAVATSGDGTLIVGGDDTGNVFAWGTKDETVSQINTDVVKQIAIAPSGSFIVITTEEGIEYLAPLNYDTPRLERIWRDNKSGSLETFIKISEDSSTVITSGDIRISSHTSGGVLNWRKDVFHSAITDMACSSDCSTIVLGSQEGNVVVLNQQGQERWEFPAGSWINGVGVSRDGSVIAVGTLDRNLYILNKEGRLVTKTTIATTIQPRSVAVSGDGRHIVIADQVSLYGYELQGVPEETPWEIITPAPGVTETTLTPVSLNTTMPKTLPPTTTKTIPRTTSTPESSLNPCLAIAALSCLLYMVLRRK